MAYKNIRERMVTVLILVGLCLGWVTEGSAAAKKYLSFGTGNPGGTFYFIGAGFASLFNKYLPEVRVIAESTAASEENFHYIYRQKMDLGLCGVSVVPTVIEKKLDLSGVRLMAMGHTSDYHWLVKKDSPVKNFSDFKGRRVAVGQPGSGALIASTRLLEAWGLTLNDFKPAYLSFTESITALKDGTVDVGYIGAGFPVASILDVARQIPIRLIPYTDEGMKRLITNWPYWVKVVIPGGTYQGIDTETPVPGAPTALFCRQELSEGIVYQLVRTLYDHSKEKDALHPQARQWNLETLFRGTDYTTQHIPFHPGTIRYLKEKGLWKGKN